MLKKKPALQVKNLYDSAIAASRRTGFTNTAAIANERAALYFLDIRDVEWASLYMTSACDLYNNWGATGKCIALVRDHAELLTNAQRSTGFSGSSAGGTCYKGRKRHTSIVDRMHNGDSFEFANANNSASHNGDSYKFANANGSASHPIFDDCTSFRKHSTDSSSFRINSTDSSSLRILDSSEALSEHALDVQDLDPFR